MIPRSAVNKFLKRKLDDHLWVKKLSKAELLDAINQLRPKPNLYEGLRAHQLACFLLGVSYPRFCFWNDMGSGKSLLTLELLKYWFQCGQIKRAVIFVTSDKAFPTWEKQIQRFNIGLPYCMLEGPSVEKWRQLQEFGDGLVLVSYPGAVALTSRSIKKGKKIKWQLDRDLIAKLGAGVGAVVLDESTKASSHQSLTHLLLERLTASAPIRYALAGRPFGRDPTLLWAQHYLVDSGETLGTTLGLFRAAFFTDMPNQWVSPHRQTFIRDYKFKNNMRTQLAQMIQHRSITYAVEECVDIPTIQPIIEEVSFSQEAAAYYRRAVDAIISANNSLRELDSLFLRMRQLSSGFVGFKNDETGERAQIEFAENPKFDLLLDLLGSLPTDRKAVVFYDFTYSGRRITEEATKLGLEPIWLWSGTKNYKADLARFERDPKCLVAIVNNKVGAYSLDGLQVANYSMFYESPVGAIDREQAERRLRRDGQLRQVFQYDLIVRGSMDAKILRYHKEAEDLKKALLRNPKAMLNDD